MRYVVSGHLRQPGTHAVARRVPDARRARVGDGPGVALRRDSPRLRLAGTRAGGAVLLDVPTELEEGRAAVEVRASGPWRLARDRAAALGPPALRSTPAAAAMSRLRPAS